MSITEVRGHPRWFKVTDDNQKENFMYVFEYPNGKASVISIVPRNLLPKKYSPFAYGVMQRKKRKKEYCGNSNSLTEAISIANKKRMEIGETDWVK
jgi:hypothetical protein